MTAQLKRARRQTNAAASIRQGVCLLGAFIFFWEGSETPATNPCSATTMYNSQEPRARSGKEAGRTDPAKQREGKGEGEKKRRGRGTTRTARRQKGRQTRRKRQRENKQRKGSKHRLDGAFWPQACYLERVRCQSDAHGIQPIRPATYREKPGAAAKSVHPANRVSPGARDRRC